MSIAIERAAISNKPIDVLKITGQVCSLSYGVGSCTASGTIKCFNTYPTCQDKANYDQTTKTYEFSSINGKPSSDDARPYLKSVTFLPTEIRENLSTRNRIKAQLVDEPELFDIGLDPYRDDRTSIQGHYWSKWMARNSNYPGWEATFYRGFIEGDGSVSLEAKQTGILENITKKGGIVTIEILDYLSSLKDIQIPAKLDIELTASVTVGETSNIYLSDVSDLETTGYLKIEDEIIYYGGKDAGQSKITSITRAMFNTEAAAYDAETTVDLCYYFSPDNPYDILVAILILAGIPSGRIDSTAFAYWKDWPHTDLDFSALIFEPVSLEKLFWEIVELLDIRVWQDENQKITCRRFMANEPEASTTTINDIANIINKTGSVDHNSQSKKTRVTINWNKIALGDLDEWKDFLARYQAVDSDAESDNNLGKIREDIIFTRWVRKGYDTDENTTEYMGRTVRRHLFNKSSFRPKFSFQLSIADEDLKTGEIIEGEIDNNELSDTFGNNYSGLFMIKSRSEGKTPGEALSYEAEALPENKIFFIAPTNYGDVDGVAAPQTPSGAGNLTLTASPYVVPTTNRRLMVFCYNGDASSVTFTATYKEYSGGPDVISDAVSGPDQDGVVITKSGTPINFYSISQIAVSGACPQIQAGMFLHYDDATDEERKYGFQALNSTAYLDANETITAYLIW